MSAEENLKYLELLQGQHRTNINAACLSFLVFTMAYALLLIVQSELFPPAIRFIASITGAVFSLAMALIYFVAIPACKVFTTEIERVCAELQLSVAPASQLLTCLVGVYAVLCSILGAIAFWIHIIAP